MIKICFPPGCYGHYLSQCLYFFTNISNMEVRDFPFNADGSSHDLRSNTLARNLIKVGHFSYETSGQYHPATLEVSDIDQSVTILPACAHWLDYYNNQFVKQAKGDLLFYVAEQISIDEIEHKLHNHWGYQDGLTSEVPRWIMRELLSFYIDDILGSAYQQDRCQLAASLKISALIFFENFARAFRDLCESLNLKVMVTDQIIESNNREFQKLQKYHGSQKRCELWAMDVVESRDSTCPALTLFDEAYIQHTLRKHKYEIRCDNLNQFPDSSNKLRPLIYRT